jgi:serine protease AprX
MRSTSRAGAHRTFYPTFLVAVAISILAAAPAAAAHKARLSADLADHIRAGSPEIDVIVHGTRQEVEALAQRYSLRIRKLLTDGAVLRVTAGELEALQQDEAVDHLSADIRYRSSSSGADIVAQSIGADQVWARTPAVPGLAGHGIGVAVIDSGVDPKHWALAGLVVASVDFTGGDGTDRFGHGTHVAATIAGRAGRLVETADYRGIASAARIVNLRVLGDDGSGLASYVIEAIDWAIENRKAYDIRVINLSLGAPVLQPYRDDPVCEAVERALAKGIIVVAAAGNFGWQNGRRVWGGITSPGNHPGAITVGSIDTHGTAQRSLHTVAPYSSQGPTRFDLVLKPDLMAPGTGVVSAEAAGSYLATTYPHRHVAGAGADAYIQLSGTSMAAAVCSGGILWLLEQRRNLTPRETKALIQLTSSRVIGEGLVTTGAGSLNLLAAAELLSSRDASPLTDIAGERVHRSGIAFENSPENEQPQLGSLRSLIGNRTSGVVWGTDANDTIIWSTNDTIIWSTAEEADTIIWSTFENDTIIWSTSTIDTIIWSTNQRQSDTIIWSTSDTIIWSTAHLNDTIIWSTFVDESSLEAAENNAL